TVPLSPKASDRASGMPSAQSSTLKPAGTLRVLIGRSLEALPVRCGAKGCRGELACSGVLPCCQEGGGDAGAGACARATGPKDARNRAAKALREFMSPPFLTALAGCWSDGPKRRWPRKLVYPDMRGLSKRVCAEAAQYVASRCRSIQ